MENEKPSIRNLHSSDPHVLHLSPSHHLPLHLPLQYSDLYPSSSQHNHTTNVDTEIVGDKQKKKKKIAVAVAEVAVAVAVEVEVVVAVVVVDADVDEDEDEVDNDRDDVDDDDDDDPPLLQGKVKEEKVKKNVRWWRGQA